MREQRIEKLMQMIAQNEHDTFALYALGMEFEGLNQFDKALNYFQKVLSLDPNKVAAYYRLAIIKQAMGEEQAALLLLNQGLELLQNSKDLKTRNEFLSLIEDIAEADA